MATNSTFISRLRSRSSLPPKLNTLIRSKNPACMASFSVVESTLSLPYKLHCIACKEVVENQDFYQRHILIQAVIFYDKNNLKEHTCVLRNCLTRDFPCPHQGCSHRMCDSEALKEHVLECKHKKESLLAISSNAVTSTTKTKMTKL